MIPFDSREESLNRTPNVHISLFKGQRRPCRRLQAPAKPFPPGCNPVRASPSHFRCMIPFCTVQNQTEWSKTRGLLHLPWFWLGISSNPWFIKICYVFILFQMISGRSKSILITSNAFKMYLNQAPGISNNRSQIHILTNSLRTRLSDCQIVRLSYCQIIRLSYCHTILLSDYQIVILSDCHIVRLSDCQIIRLSDYQIVILSDYHIIILSCCHITIL